MLWFNGTKDPLVDGRRIMKMKNVCYVRHILTDDNFGSTYDIISQIPSQNSH